MGELEGTGFLNFIEQRKGKEVLTLISFFSLAISGEEMVFNSCYREF